MTTTFTRIAAAATLTFLTTSSLASAQPAPSIREAAARVSFAQAGAPAPRDSNVNGVAIGAAVGAAGMVGLIVVLSSRCGEGCENDLTTGGAFAAIGMGAGGGAVVGYLIDRAHRGTRRTIAVSPSVTPRERRVTLAVRF